MKAELGIILLIFVVIQFLFLSGSAKKKPSSKPKEDESDTVTIRPWQYCQGCKHTVQLYAILSAKEMARMKKKGIPSKSQMDSVSIANGMCEHDNFYSFKPFVRWSCVKIIQESSQMLLQAFLGNQSASDMIGKHENFKRKQQVIVCLLLFDLSRLI
jgi:hypothetical protein